MIGPWSRPEHSTATSTSTARPVTSSPIRVGLSNQDSTNSPATKYDARHIQRHNTAHRGDWILRLRAGGQRVWEGARRDPRRCFFAWMPAAGLEGAAAPAGCE